MWAPDCWRHEDPHSAGQRSVRMKLVASTASGFDQVSIYECPECGHGVTIQTQPAVGGLPPVVRSVVQTPAMSA